MSSLYVDRRGVTLKADGEALVFYENGQRVGTVPLAPLARVFLRGEVTLTSSLLGKLGERGIGVVVLSGRKALPTMLLGRPHNDAARIQHLSARRQCGRSALLSGENRCLDQSARRRRAL